MREVARAEGPLLSVILETVSLRVLLRTCVTALTKPDWWAPAMDKGMAACDDASISVGRHSETVAQSLDWMTRSAFSVAEVWPIGRESAAGSASGGAEVPREPAASGSR